MQQTTKTDRGQTKGSTQVFRDVATLLLLVLLAVSVRFDRPEEPSAVEPLPGGVQAAELDEAASSERSMPPAEPCPKARPAVLEQATPSVSPKEVDRTENLGKRFLILRDGEIREIRLSARFRVEDPAPDCGDRRITLVRS